MFIISSILYNIGSLKYLGYLSLIYTLKKINFDLNNTIKYIPFIIIFFIINLIELNDSIVKLFYFTICLIILSSIDSFNTISKYQVKIFKALSFIYIAICVLFFNESLFISGIDKNIFMVPFVPLFIYYAINPSYFSILIFILGFLSNSRLIIYIFVIAMIVNFFTKNLKVEFFRAILAILLGIFIPTIILIIFGYISEDISGSRGILEIFDASNMERSIALQDALIYLIDNPWRFFQGGAWNEYSSEIVTRVHNDFLQITIKHGILGLILFIVLLARIFTKLTMPISAIFSLSVFSSLLGGIAWLVGLFWLFAYIILFNDNKESKKL